MDPVDSVADILEHALIGHEEVAVLEAGFAAEGEEQRDTQPSDGPHFYRSFSIFFCSFFLVIFSCLISFFFFFAFCFDMG